MRGHCKTRLFSLIGRRIVLHTPHAGCTEGIIVEKIGSARFGCHLRESGSRLYRLVTVDLHRREFKLPPLPREERKAIWLSDYDGFVYADEPNF